MIIDLYKDGLIYEFNFFNPFTRKTEIKEKLNDGYELMFDTRELTNIQGKCGTLILENDIVVPDRLLSLKNDIHKRGFKSKDLIITSLHPQHFETLNNEIYSNDESKFPKQYQPTLIKNILIDSLFENRNQIKYAILKCFNNFQNLNYFIISHGKLLNVINNELLNHMEEYPMRNSAYKNFNELTATLIKNKFYDVELISINGELLPDYVIEIIYNSDTNTVSYGEKYKWNYNNTLKYNKFKEIEKKDKWEI